MKTTDWVFAQAGKAAYDLVRHDTGGFAAMLTEGIADWTDPSGKAHRFYLRFYASQDNRTSDMDVYEVIYGFLRPVSFRKLERQSAEDDWVTTQMVEYTMSGVLGGHAYLPADIKEGDTNVVTSAGLWHWSHKDGQSASGQWQCTSEWSMLLGRITLHEKYRENSGQNGEWGDYDRLIVFDKNGLQGLDDKTQRDWPGVVCRREWL
jgi:hypothetical protein